MIRGIKEKILTIFVTIFGTITLILGLITGFIGATCLCSIPFISGLLALFGAGSVLFLNTYSPLFIVIGVVSLILALILYSSMNKSKNVLNVLKVMGIKTKRKKKDEKKKMNG